MCMTCVGLFSLFYLDKSILLAYANVMDLKGRYEWRAAAAIFVIGSYYLAEYMQRRERRMALAASAASNPVRKA